MDTCICINNAYIAGNSTRDFPLTYSVHCHGNLPFLEYLFKKFESFRSFYVIFKGIISAIQISICESYSYQFIFY